MNEKHRELTKYLPEGFEGFSEIRFDRLRYEASKLDAEKQEIVTRFATFAVQLEGFGNFKAHLLRTIDQRTKLAFKIAIGFETLWPIIMFSSFWENLFGPLQSQSILIPKECVNLELIHNIISSQRFNKIRNAIAHLGIDFNEDNIVLRDKNFNLTLHYLEIVTITSFLMDICIYMGVNANQT